MTSGIVLAILLTVAAWIVAGCAWKLNPQSVTLSGCAESITFFFLAWVVIWLVSGQSPHYNFAPLIVACIAHALLWLVVIWRRTPTSLFR